MSEPTSGAGSPALPTGTLTFFRSDLEGSMALLQALGAEYDTANAEHHAIVRGAIDRYGGQIVRTEGDATFAVFTDALAGCRAAIEVQRTMAAHPWPVGHAFRVRIGLHAGGAHRAGDDYGGLEVSRAARIADLGSGGQTVISEPVRALLGSEPPDGWHIRDLGAHRLRGVWVPERIYQLAAPDLPSAFPPLRTGGGSDIHLPGRVTSLIGRDRDLASLERLLAETRLLTLTGPGGIGKTTLAIELARRCAADAGDGAWFVDLQSIRDVSAVRGEIAYGLGLFDGATGPAADRLHDHLAEREVLIVIDNVEQVIEAAGEVGDILAASPLTRIIATSRVPLRLSAEQEYVVGPLALDPPDGEASEAERLFIDRARRVRPNLRIEAEERRTIRRLCRMLDGLPLAIELAAARVSGLPLELIERRLSERLPLPGVGPRDLPDRHRTVEATVGWSYGLLEPALQRLLARLSVFVRSFELEQAEDVCGPADDELGVDVLDGIYALVERSLVHRQDDAVGGVRFGMLETIRAYARARLDEAGETDSRRERHMHAFGALAAKGAEHLHLSQQRPAWLDRLEADAPNLWEATRFAIDRGATQVALALVGELWRLWLAVGRLVEARGLIEAALALPGAEARTKARMKALDAAGSAAYWASDQVTARSWYEAQLALAEEFGDRQALFLAWLNLYFCLIYGGDPGGAAAALAEARHLAESGAHDLARSAVETAEGVMVMMLATRQPDEYVPKLEALAQRLLEARSPWSRSAGETYRAIAAFLGRRDSLETGRALVDAIRANIADRDVADACLAVWTGGLVMASADAEIGATLRGAADAALERYGVRPLASPESFGLSDPVESMLEVLGKEGYSAAVDRGRRMSLEDTADFIESRLDPESWSATGQRAAGSPRSGAG